MAARSSFAVCLLYWGYIEQVLGAGCRPTAAAQWSREARPCTEMLPDASTTLYLPSHIRRPAGKTTKKQKNPARQGKQQRYVTFMSPQVFL